MRLETKVLEPEDTVALMKSITPERCQQELQEVGGADFGFAFGDMARFRVSVFKQRGNVAMVLRQIPNKLLNFEDLGTPPVLKDLIMRPRGLILVTGPTGSGKTTTLAAMIDYINDNVDHHIITIEDPIEFYHQHKKSTVNQREVGVDVPSFAEAIRRALRQDPDVILVGEMRDLETIEAAITAAETGHIVFGTLHTTGAQGTVNRIIDVFPTNQQEQIRTQLSDVDHRHPLAGAAAARSAAAAWRPTRCWSSRPAIANLIRENKTFRITSAIQTGAQAGHAAAGRPHVQALARRASSRRTRSWSRPTCPTSSAAKIARAERGMFEDEDEAHGGRQRGSDEQEQPDSSMNRDSRVTVTIDLEAMTTMAMRRIGQILVDLGFIDRRSARACCSTSSSSGPANCSGRSPSSMGLVNDDQLAQALAEQMGMQVVNLADVVDPARGARPRHRADGPALPDHSDQLSRTTR